MPFVYGALNNAGCVASNVRASEWIQNDSEKSDRGLHPGTFLI